MKLKLDSWEQALADAMGVVDTTVNPHCKVPRGWFTVRDEANRRGIGYGGAQKRLNDKWRLGLLERKEHQNPSGRGSPVFIYRPKKRCVSKE